MQKVVCDVIFATAFAAVLFAYDARLAGLILIAGAVKDDVLRQWEDCTLQRTEFFPG